MHAVRGNFQNSALDSNDSREKPTVKNFKFRIPMSLPRHSDIPDKLEFQISMSLLRHKFCKVVISDISNENRISNSFCHCHVISRDISEVISKISKLKWPMTSQSKLVKVWREVIFGLQIYLSRRQRRSPAQCSLALRCLFVSSAIFFLCHCGQLHGELLSTCIACGDLWHHKSSV